MRNNSLIIGTLILFLVNSCNTKNKGSAYPYDDFKTVNPDFKLSSKAVASGKLLDDFKCEDMLG